jgi:hypothetical protein
MLLQAYIALVLFHAGYLESVSEEWAPWVAFILLPLVAWYSRLRNNMAAPGMFIWLAVVIIFMLNYLRIITGLDRQTVIAPDWLSVMYALELYVGYYLLRRAGTAKGLWPLLLVGGHLAAVAAAVQAFHARRDGATNEADGRDDMPGSEVTGGAASGEGTRDQGT